MEQYLSLSLILGLLPHGFLLIKLDYHYWLKVYKILSEQSAKLLHSLGESRH